MSLTPMDIHNKEFKSARLGGYNEEDVDSFLDLVADEIESIEAEYGSMKAELESARKKLEEFEEMQSSLQNALITASKSAEDVRNQSSREAGEMLEKARKESEAIIRAAQEQAGRIIAQSENEGQRIESKFNKLREIKKQYLESIRHATDVQMRELKSLEEQDRQYDMITEKKVIQNTTTNNASQNNAAQKEPVNVNQQETGVPPVTQEPAATAPQENPQQVQATPSVPVTPQEPVGGIAIEEGSTQGTLIETGEVNAEPPPPPIQQKSEISVQESAEVDCERKGSQGQDADTKPEIVHGRMKENGVSIASEDIRPIASPPQTIKTVDAQSEVSREEVPRGNVATRTEDLVEEILGIDPDDDLYAEFDDVDEEDNGRGKRRLGRKEKKNKNKFWE